MHCSTVTRNSFLHFFSKLYVTKAFCCCYYCYCCCFLCLNISFKSTQYKIEYTFSTISTVIFHFYLHFLPFQSHFNCVLKFCSKTVEHNRIKTQFLTTALYYHFFFYFSTNIYNECVFREKEVKSNKISIIWKDEAQASYMKQKKCEMENKWTVYYFWLH